MGFEDKDFENARSGMNKNLYNGNDRSSSQLYKQAGNSIVVDVLLHIMENLYDAMPYLFDDIEVGSFFSGIGAFEKALDRLEPEIDKHTNTIEGKNLELSQVGYINGYNGDANRIYDGSQLSRALKAEAGGGWSQDRLVSDPVILDIKQLGREGKPRVYRAGICPTLAARDYKDPLRILETE